MIMKKREGQVVEDSKTALVVRGNKAAAEVMSLLRALHRLRYPLSVLYSRPHETHPFEDVTKVEHMCRKSDHALFVFGSSSKKRPFRMIFGRMFNQTLRHSQHRSCCRLLLSQ